MGYQPIFDCVNVESTNHSAVSAGKLFANVVSFYYQILVYM
jgi:hypothetical protein